MGAIIAKFRKKRTTFEVLENLESKIRAIEEYKSSTELQRKKVVGQLILFSVGLYVIAALLFYFFFFPATLYDQLFYITPLLIFPIIIVFVKKLLTWFYNRKIRRNQTKLATMKTEKKKLLDEVMETETYKKAKDILEKFAPEQLRKSGAAGGTDGIDLTVTPLKSQLSSALKHRLPSSTPQPALLSSSTPANNYTSGNYGLLATKTPMPYNMSMASKTPIPIINSELRLRQGGAANNNKQLALTGAAGTIPANLPMPRTILARDRSVLDKMVEYLIGDGPNNRFALICKNCSSHNGMALREEFEYVSFRCCYCFTLNPARKLRVAAPKLEPIKIGEVSDGDESTSESERNSPSDTDSDVELLKNVENKEESLDEKSNEEKKED